MLVRAAVAGVIILLVSVSSVVACRICISAVSVTPGQRIDNADQAVLATANAKGDAWTVITGILGSGPFDTRQMADDVSPFEAASDKAVLLVRDDLGRRWKSMGEIGLAHADWLKSFANSQPPSSAIVRGETYFEQAAWRVRLALVYPKANCGDPAIEAIAHGELSRAPYSAIRALGRTLDAADLQARIAGESEESRKATYILLLGATGKFSLAKWIQQRLKVRPPQGATTELAALLAADLELAGEERLEWLATAYLLDRHRNPAEIDAALRALSAHGDADTAVSRADIVNLYRLFISERPAMIDTVVSDLERWKDWHATADVVALLANGSITDPASRFVALRYVQSSPDALDPAELKALDD